jgi:hypothetical protein
VDGIAADCVSASPVTASRPGILPSSSNQNPSNINPGIVGAPELVFRRGGGAGTGTLPGY